MKRFLLIALGVVAASTSFGQATITSGTSTFGWTSPTDANISGAAIRTGTGGGGSVVFKASGAADQMFQQWFWYRVNGVNSREFALSNLVGKTVSGNNMILNYVEPEAFSADVNYTLTNQASGSALLTATVFIKNTTTSGASLDMSFFNYFDFDLNATGGDDAAQIASNNPSLRMLINDAAGPQSAEYRAIDGTAYQVGAFSGLRTLLTDANVNNLNNTGAPFGPGDFSGASQWSFNLNPGERIALQSSFVLNPVPEPGTILAVAAGLGFLAARRRRK